MRHLLHNPHYYSGAIVARLSTAAASVLWAVVTIAVGDALRAWPITRGLMGDAIENTMAWVLLAVALTSLYRIATQATPFSLGWLIYGYMAIIWIYSAVTLYVAVYTGIIPPRPGQIGAVTVMAILALYGFVANPKRDL